MLLRAVASAEAAGPSALAPLLMWSAWQRMHAGDTDGAAVPLTRGLQLGRDEGNTYCVLACCFMTAAVATRRRQLESGAALLAGTARYADPKGLRGWEYTASRAEAETAVDASPVDLSPACARGAAMTIDDLVNEALRVVGQGP